MITGHYRARNIFAVQEWAFAWIKERGPGDLYDAPREEWPPRAQAVADVGDWCATWLENDPRDNGGDGSWRRLYGRSGWREVYADYRRLSAGASDTV